DRTAAARGHRRRSGQEKKGCLKRHTFADNSHERNGSSPTCYHFATELLSTEQDRAASGERQCLKTTNLFRRIGTGRSAKLSLSPNYECVALPAALPRQEWLTTNAILPLSIYTDARRNRRGIGTRRSSHSERGLWIREQMMLPICCPRAIS